MNLPTVDAYRAPRKQTRSGLVMTDIGFLVAVGLALFMAVDPLDWRLGKIALTKHWPLMLMLPFVLLTVVAGRINRISCSPPQVSSIFRPLLGLAVLIVAGSLYARFHLGIQNTFLFTGIYMLAAPVSAYMLIRSANPRHLLRAYLGMLLLAGVIVVIGLVYNYGVRQVFHELEYLVPPLAVFFAFWMGNKGLRWAGMLFFLIAAILFKKNTGYLTGLLILGYLILFIVWPNWKRHDSLKKVAKVYLLLIALLGLAAVSIYLWTYKAEYLPSGNLQFRLLTYENAWTKFKSSPLWGTVFAAPATEEFTGFETGVANNMLPTHSDILDILANGGLLGIALWLWALLRIAKQACFGVLQPENLEYPLAPYAHMLACMSLAAILTYAFNPILLQPSESFLVWTNLGLLVGISLHFNRNVLPQSV